MATTRRSGCSRSSSRRSTACRSHSWASSPVESGSCAAAPAGRVGGMKETAKRAAIATLIVGGIVVLSLALWKLKLLAALLFFAFILAAAMRPTIEKLAKRCIPRGAGIALHYVVLLGM